MPVLEATLYDLSRLFLVPVIVLILASLAYAVVALGGFASESVQRMRGRKGGRLAAHRQRTGCAVDDLELVVLRRLEWLRIVSRAAPMLGLVATMIPMGPALLALGTALHFAELALLHRAFGVWHIQDYVFGTWLMGAGAAIIALSDVAPLRIELLRALAHGAGYTVAVTLACAATGFVTGLLLTGLRRVQWPALQALLALWVFILRGVPVLVVTFIALLELAKETLVEITQAEAFAPIYVRLSYTPSD